MRLKQGTQIGPYTVQRYLGRGGTATVWAARHEQLGIEVAIKVLFSQDRAHQRRLIQEGRAQAALAHPNILPVRDIIDLDGAPGLVMSLVRGPPLDRLLRSYRPDTAEAAALLQGILAGLGHAHQHGLVHRDLKPGNVLLAVRGGQLVPQVADFGLVKALDGPRRTRTGAVMGTLSYAAPEQLLDASSVTPQADLFSVGVVLVELLSGKLPFPGTTLRELLEQHRAGPDLQGVPEPWRPLCARLLQHDPDQRPEHCAAVEEILTDLHPPTAHPVLAVDGALAAVALGLPDQETAQRGPATWSLTATSDAVDTEHPHNLPDARDPFIGRKAQIRELAQRLSVSAIVSVLGPGGAGKTRLAIEVARQQRDAHPGGVWFCDLAEARKRDDIIALVSSVLGLLDLNTTAAIGRALAERGPTLLVLDNFEQLIAFAEETVGRWRAAAPEARFLITSRQPLALSDEQRYRLDLLDEEEAVELFTARARTHDPRFTLDDRNRSDVITLIKQLDGLPLAIELAAARIRVMRPTAMITRMKERFRLLRHNGAALQATLDWSWSLLTDAEQDAFAQCAIFEGGFTLAAAESVIQPASPQSPWTADLIESLVDKSLLHALGDNALGEPRFRMLVSLRDYADQKLDDAARSACLKRHMRFFASLGDPDAIRPLRWYGDVKKARALDESVDNIEAATHYAADHAHPIAAAQTALILGKIQYLNNRRAAAMAALRRALQVLEEAPGDPAQTARLRAEVLLQLAEIEVKLETAVETARRAVVLFEALGDRVGQGLALIRASVDLYKQNHWKDAEHGLQQAIQLAQQCDHRRLEAEATEGLGAMYRIRGQLGKAEKHLRRALDFAEEDQFGATFTSQVLGVLALTYSMSGRLTEAEPLMKRALQLNQRAGGRKGTSVLLINLGSLYAKQGRFELAEQYLDKAIRRARLGGSRFAEATTLLKLLHVYEMQGRLEQGEKIYKRVLGLLRKGGNRDWEGATLCNLGGFYFKQARYSEAKQAFTASLDIAREIGDPRSASFSLYNLGHIQLQKQSYEEAVRHFTEALRLGEETDNIRLVGMAYVALGELRHKQGRLEEARHNISVGEQRLRDNRLVHPLAEVLCTRAEMEHAEGNAHRARQALTEAQHFAEEMALPETSPLILRIARLRARLDGDPEA
ncbi:MAG: tetratricopeptide repeat protein [Myxococcota bacterium]